MNEQHEYDLIQARLHMRRKQWDTARALLEALYTRDRKNEAVKAMLLKVEKEQAFVKRENQKYQEMDPRERSKDQLGFLALGILLLAFMLLGGIRTAATIYSQGWHADVLLQSSVSRTGQPIEHKVPVSTMIGLVPFCGITGIALIRWSLRGFRIM